MIAKIFFWVSLICIPATVTGDSVFPLSKRAVSLDNQYDRSILDHEIRADFPSLIDKTIFPPDAQSIPNARKRMFRARHHRNRFSNSPRRNPHGLLEQLIRPSPHLFERNEKDKDDIEQNVQSYTDPMLLKNSRSTIEKQGQDNPLRRFSPSKALRTKSHSAPHRHPMSYRRFRQPSERKIRRRLRRLRLQWAKGGRVGEVHGATPLFHRMGIEDSKTSCSMLERKSKCRNNKLLCGSNGITYDNFCQLRLDICRAMLQDLPLISIKHAGACDEDTFDDRTLRPVKSRLSNTPSHYLPEVAKMKGWDRTTFLRAAKEHPLNL